MFYFKYNFLDQCKSLYFESMQKRTRISALLPKDVDYSAQVIWPNFMVFICIIFLFLIFLNILRTAEHANNKVMGFYSQ